MNAYVDGFVRLSQPLCPATLIHGCPENADTRPINGREFQLHGPLAEWIRGVRADWLTEQDSATEAVASAFCRVFLQFRDFIHDRAYRPDSITRRRLERHIAEERVDRG